MPFQTIIMLLLQGKIYNKVMIAYFKKLPVGAHAHNMGGQVR